MHRAGYPGFVLADANLYRLRPGEADIRVHPHKRDAYFHKRCKPCRAARARGDKPARELRLQPPLGFRFCAACQTTRPLEEFLPATGNGKHLRSSCIQRRTHAAQTSRTCTECGQTKAITEFVRIRACVNGWYGRCRLCRAQRARERYQSDPEERERQKDRVRRNRRRRQQPGTLTSA
jgi:hypothetical protein